MEKVRIVSVEDTALKTISLASKADLAGREHVVYPADYPARTADMPLTDLGRTLVNTILAKGEVDRVTVSPYFIVIVYSAYVDPTVMWWAVERELQEHGYRVDSR